MSATAEVIADELTSIREMSDAELVVSILYLTTHDHTGTWGQKRLADLQYEARRRMLKP